MPALPPTFRWAIRAVSLAAMLLLTACGPGKNQFAPACPRPAILAEAADLNRYRMSMPGAGRDVTDLILHARIVTVTGNCSPGDTKATLNTTVQIGVDVSRGPAMGGRQTELTYFIAIVDGQTVIDKRIYRSPIVFPNNVDRMTVGSEDVGFVLPIGQGKSGGSYTFLVGFQPAPGDVTTDQFLTR